MLLGSPFEVTQLICSATVVFFPFSLSLRVSTQTRNLLGVAVTFEDHEKFCFWAPTLLIPRTRARTHALVTIYERVQTRIRKTID